MSQKRIRRVYVEDGCLMVASFCLEDTSLQRFDPDDINSSSVFILAKQINMMIEEAGIRGTRRGVKRGVEQGAEECLRLVIRTIKDLGDEF